MFFFFFQAEDGIRDYKVTGVQTCALPICLAAAMAARRCTQADVDDLQDLLLKMKRCESDQSEWITVHRRFHERFCRISAAPRLCEQISALHSVVEPLMRIWLENNEPSPKLQRSEEHTSELQSPCNLVCR